LKYESLNSYCDRQILARGTRFAITYTFTRICLVSLWNLGIRDTGIERNIERGVKIRAMLMSLIALLPIVILVFLVLFSHRSFLVSVILALTVLLTIGFFVWKISPIVLSAAAIKGVFVALEIILIIFGALLVFGIFRRLGGERSAEQIFDRISPDYRVKAVLIAWAFICFLEGISGFGTPPMITVPILISIGLTPLSSVVVSLIGDTLPVTFGAVGLPVTYGFASTVGSGLANEAALFISILNIIISPFVVAAIFFMSSKEKKGRLKDVVRNLPFILFSAFAVSIPSFVVMKFFGPEVPSIIGGLCGMILISLYAIIHREKEKEENKPEKGNIIPFVPYIIVAGTLAITRIPYIKNLLGNLFEISLSSILKTNISYSIHPLASPAAIFFATAAGFLVYFFLRRNKKYSAEILREAAKRVVQPAAALICIIIFVQIMLNSGLNDAGLPNMITSIANIFRSAGKVTTLFISPAIGAIGAFIAGSSTVSNLLFSSIQQSAAVLSGNAEKLIIAMQGMGSAAGNVVAIHNILAALAVAGAGAAMEKRVLRTNLPYLAIYLILAGILGFAITALALV